MDIFGVSWRFRPISNPGWFSGAMSHLISCQGQKNRPNIYIYIERPIQVGCQTDELLARTFYNLPYYVAFCLSVQNREVQDLWHVSFFKILCYWFILGWSAWWWYTMLWILMYLRFRILTKFFIHYLWIILLLTYRESTSGWLAYLSCQVQLDWISTESIILHIEQTPKEITHKCQPHHDIYSLRISSKRVDDLTISLTNNPRIQRGGARSLRETTP